MKKPISLEMRFLYLVIGWSILIFVLSTILGCQTKKTLREDFFPASLDKGYLSAEIHALGRLHIGVASVVTPKGSGFKFSVAGIHRGVVSVRSDSCGYAESKSYTGSRLVDFELIPSLHTEKSRNRCFISVFVHPIFSESHAGRVPWRGFAGLIAVRFDSRESITQSARITKGEAVPILLRVRERTRFYARGCGLKIDERLLEGPPKIETLMPKAINRVCVIDGFLAGKTQNETIQVLVSQFEDDFMPLAEPSVAWTESGFKVVADPMVAFLSFGEEESFSSEAFFRYRKGSAKFLRGYTSNGRTFTCEMNKDEEPICFR